MAERIEVRCSYTKLMSIDDILDFQGNLKRRSPEHLDKIMKSIFQFGFSFPFFVWTEPGTGNPYCIDGHGRLAALYRFREDGGEVPELPVVFIQAEDRKDAKQRLLRLNSFYGEIDPEGLQDFVDGIDVNWADLELPGHEKLSFMNDVDLDNLSEDNPEEKPEKGPKLCPHCGAEV